jgi:hypothetical protein
LWTLARPRRTLTCTYWNAVIGAIVGRTEGSGGRWTCEEAERARGGRRGRNALGRTLEASGDTTLDSPAKRILSWSPVLARVIKYSLD